MLKERPSFNAKSQDKENSRDLAIINTSILKVSGMIPKQPFEPHELELKQPKNNPLLQKASSFLEKISKSIKPQQISTQCNDNTQTIE